MARILIVDDSIIMRRNLKVILTQAGHEIAAEASNGKEAYVEYEKCLPDLVTMDITMPVMNGIEAVKKIITNYPDAKIIMISALDQRNMVFEALENGAKHYIIKPITPDKVLTVLDAVLMDNDSNEVAVSEKVHNKTKQSTNEITNSEGMQDDESAPFTIENKDGRFIIVINRQLDNQCFATLNMAVQGFMFIKPLNIIIDLCNFDITDEELLIKVIEIINKVKAAGGTAKLCCNSETLIQAIKQKDANIEIE